MVRRSASQRGAIRAAARVVLVWAAVASLAGGCRSTYYDEYRAAHPAFQGELPREGADLRETLAALYAPNRLETIEVRLEALRIYRVVKPEWEALSFDEIRAGAPLSSDATYVVVATVGCRSLEGLREESARRTGYYLLPGDALAAWDHYAFRTRCTATNAFRAARGALVPVEIAASAEIAAHGGAARIAVVDAYQRGLSYFEAGRLEEARAMLTVGEAAYRAATASLQVGDRAPDSLVEATRLRATLMRALGVVAR